ncbi:unnamed protein product [Clavelina lepadiformis]|uniref:Helicase-like transcription factor n=1 Tax=Clavelina lepadiformis TaxID=159417 RepID=A0ABP0FLB5_CLALP
MELYSIPHVEQEVVLNYDGDGDSSNSSANDDYFGFLNGVIVGIRYYSGMVSNREMVGLQREPNNPYDCNAVRVNNIRGEQVGHIKRELARALAAVVDRGLARVEGLVPRGSENKFSIPVVLSFWGDLSKRDLTVKELKKYGYSLQTKQPFNSNQGSGSYSTSYHKPKLNTQFLTQTQISSQLDTLFENLNEADQTAELEECEPVRQALCWMTRKETGLDLPPFWEKVETGGGNKLFKNNVTNFHTKIEPTKVCGGILADDMGLGKTLVVISLILGHSCNSTPLFTVSKKKNTKISKHVSPPSTSHVIPDVKLTEVVEVVSQNDVADTSHIKHDTIVKQTSDSVSSSRLRQKRKTKKPARYLEVNTDDDGNDDEAGVAKKNKDARRKRKRRKQVNGDDEYIPKCSTESIKTPLYQHADPLAKSSAESGPTFKKGKSMPTLIVCPLSVISNWENQIYEHVHDTADVKIATYHGTSKIALERQILMEKDIVITTYQTLAMEYKKNKKSGCLLGIDWLRVILDEGHIVRNPSALQTQACFAIKAKRKWVVTGTPIQNSMKDLWTIVSFLGLEPFTDRGWWRRTIERPLRNGEEAAIKRVQCMMGCICMRRTKTQQVNGQPLVNLPPRNVMLQTFEMLPNDKLNYKKLEAAGKRTISNLIDSGSAMSRYADILVILMRLRQLSCHSFLAKEALADFSIDVGTSLPEAEVKQLVLKMIILLNSGSVEDCCVCLDSLKCPVITRCAHIFCKPCISEVIASALGHSMCPLCRSPVKQEELTEMPPDGKTEDEEVDSDEAMKPSAKINALISQLLEVKRSNANTKSLVVSQFTSFLKIIEKHLQKMQIQTIMFHGGMSSAARKQAINDFQHGTATIMLLSLKSGGVGLNLTAASNVFLMEPAWNPSAEEQCFDRVHRLGQTKPVTIYKFVCSNTIEEKVLEIQDMKRKLALESLKQRSSEDRKHQTLSELKMLMDMQ